MFIEVTNILENGRESPIMINSDYIVSAVPTLNGRTIMRTSYSLEELGGNGNDILIKENLNEIMKMLNKR